MLSSEIHIYCALQLIYIICSQKTLEMGFSSYLTLCEGCDSLAV